MLALSEWSLEVRGKWPVTPTPTQNLQVAAIEQEMKIIEKLTGKDTAKQFVNKEPGLFRQFSPLPVPVWYQVIVNGSHL